MSLLCAIAALRIAMDNLRNPLQPRNTTDRHNTNYQPDNPAVKLT